MIELPLLRINIIIFKDLGLTFLGFYTLYRIIRLENKLTQKTGREK